MFMYGNIVSQTVKLYKRHLLYGTVRLIVLVQDKQFPVFAWLWPRSMMLPLKGYSGFRNPFSWLSLFGFNIMFDHMRVHIPNIGSLAHS